MKGKLRWGDGVVSGIVLLCAAALAAFMVFHSIDDQLYAEVWQDHKLVKRVRLLDDTELTINVEGHNTVILEGRTARIESADCRDQVCVRTGLLTRAGQVAVCLPNRVVVKLVGQKEHNEVDAVTT